MHKRHQLRSQEQKLRERLGSSVAAKWPALLGPYTPAYHKMAAAGTIRSANQWLQQQADYSNLVEVQQADVDLDQELLSLERDTVQLQKLLHLRKLATIKGQLLTYGNDSDIESYQSLVSCEETWLDDSDSVHSQVSD